MRLAAARNAAIAGALAGALLGLSGQAAADPRCVCRYAGDDYFLGECVCMKTAAGEQYACCDRVLNNTSWSFAADGCNVAEAPPAAPAGTAQLAVSASDPAAVVPAPASPATLGVTQRP